LPIGVDLDGTISKAKLYNPSLRLPWWLFILLIPFILLIRPNREAVKKIREMRDWGHEIIIVSARPPWTTNLTMRWLSLHRVPFDKIFCVGFGKGTKDRKLEVIKREKIKYFFDDNKKISDFLNHNSVVTTHL